MKSLKIFLIVLITFIFVSCGSLTITSDTQQRYNNYDVFYNAYDYNEINLFYLTNPGYFYNNIYIDAYGRQRYGHRHPNYIRYCKEKRIRTKRYSRSVKKRKLAPTFTHTNPRDPITVTSTSSPGYRTYSIRGTRSTGNSDSTPRIKYKKRTTNPTRTLHRTKSIQKRSVRSTQSIRRSRTQKITQRRSSKIQ